MFKEIEEKCNIKYRKDRKENRALPHTNICIHKHQKEKDFRSTGLIYLQDNQRRNSLQS